MKLSQKPAASSLLLRFRYGTGQQLKWVGYAAVVMLALIGANTLLGYNRVALVATADPVLALLSYALWGLTFRSCRSPWASQS